MIKKPDYIICGHLNFSPILFLVNYFIKIPYSISIYGIEMIPNVSNIIKKCILNANIIITISNYTKDLIIKQAPEIKSRIFLLKSSVNKDHFKQKRQNKILMNKYNLFNKNIILTLARLSNNEEKGQHRILQALPEVLKKFPNTIYLIVGGGNDRRVDEILHSNPKLKEKVIMTGKIENDDKVDFYNLADVFVMPSKNEGFGIVFIEALACGVPVISSDGYGCREGLLNGEIGLLVNPNKKKEIADAIKLFLDKKVNPNLLNKKNIRRLTIKEYGMERWDNDINFFLQKIKK